MWPWEECTHEADWVLVRAECIPSGANNRAPLQQVLGARLSHAAEGAGVGGVSLVCERKGVSIVGDGSGSSQNVIVVVENACVVQSCPRLTIQHVLWGASGAPSVRWTESPGGEPHVGDLSGAASGADVWVKGSVGLVPRGRLSGSAVEEHLGHVKGSSVAFAFRDCSELKAVERAPSLCMRTSVKCVDDSWGLGGKPEGRVNVGTGGLDHVFRHGADGQRGEGFDEFFGDVRGGVGAGRGELPGVVGPVADGLPMVCSGSGE